MNAASIGTLSDLPSSNTINSGNFTKKQSTTPPLSNGSSFNACFVNEYYAAQSISLNYSSPDGDSVSLSIESIEYGKSILSLATNGNSDDMKKLISQIKNDLLEMKKTILLHVFGNDASPTDTIKEPKPLEIPEYWNAENTSQRIVDFATSFYGAFKGAGDEFLSIIKNAIEEGFKQARDIIGELPDEVSNLVDDTYNLTMEKLTLWAEKEKILVQQTEDALA